MTLPINLTINTTRLLRELHHLSTLTDCPPSTQPNATAVTRIVFTPRDLEARAYITSLATTAGFQIRVDPIGNTFIRWPGSDPNLPAIGTGSHTDAIPHAGMYDGTVGVLGGLEAMRSLKESGFLPRRSLELLMLTSEEPTRFGIGCIGSRLLGGVLDPHTADNLPDRLPETDPQAPTGLTLQAVRTEAGFLGSLDSVKLPPNHYAAWLELHIEQGPLLERAMQQHAANDAQAHQRPNAALTPHRPSDNQALQRPGDNQVPQGFSLASHGANFEEGVSTPERTILGIVTNIAAPASYRYIIEGFGGHAGALLMPDRRDALTAAAELILSVERHTLAANAASNTSDSVATIGTVAVHPGAVNSVPSRVTLMLDIRDTDPTRRDHIMSAICDDIHDIETRRTVKITEQLINADQPATSDPHILSTLESICQAEHVPYKKMVSRAYHDSSFIARIAPIAMIFIPCRNGVSHRPDEYASPDSIALGTRILALALSQLSRT